ncbi:cation:proton antiporter [Kaistella palustris]|uniref:cation:proton antiporter n=1 Tax=Kaistella palustris TaxID=493376 RepID=UPI000424E60F|nr:sodium:proton antiporter [Kaistella palustris]
MPSYNYIIILISLSAFFAYLNQRFIKLPFVIGLFFLSSLFSLVALVLKSYYSVPFDQIRELVINTDISKSVLNIFLGFLLFAGSMHTNWFTLRKYLKDITVLALGGVIFSTLFVAVAFFYVAHWLGLEIPFLYCLIFGALISPTDPIAVLSILKQADVPEKIEVTLVGESLFNDGVGVVIFIALTQMISAGAVVFDFPHFGFLFLQEAGGGIVFGLVLGYILHYLLKSINHYETEVLLTLAFVMLGYFISAQIHISGALAMVIMGLMVGNFRKDVAMSNETKEYVAKFWELLEIILNALLFLLIALVLVVLDFNLKYMVLGVLTILILMVSRYFTVNIPRKTSLTVLKMPKPEADVIILGGLRGGLSLALVLSLPASEVKDVLLIVTYICVAFSVLVQGTTIGTLAKKILRKMQPSWEKSARH